MTATNTTPGGIDGADLVEVAEILEFLVVWFAHDSGDVAASFNDHLGTTVGGYDLHQLGQDLDRLRRLLDAHTGRSS